MRILVFLVALLFTGAVAANQLIIDGKTYDAGAVTITIDGGVVSITTEKPLTPGSSPPPAPVPKPPPVTGPVPGNVQMQQAINWANPGGRREYSRLGGEIMSFPFTTTANPDYFGSVSVAQMTGTGSVTRRVWISRAPGVGFDEARAARLAATGVEVVTVRWAQRPGVRAGANIGTNQRWYLNVQNVNCSSRCGVYLSFAHNAQP
jgi:hypothetical protein